jgi:hypothetical protein
MRQAFPGPYPGNRNSVLGHLQISPFGQKGLKSMVLLQLSWRRGFKGLFFADFISVFNNFSIPALPFII